MEKIVIITLFTLTFTGKVEMLSFELPSKQSCSSWWHHNIKPLPIKERPFSQRNYRLYKGLHVVDYRCSGH